MQNVKKTVILLMVLLLLAGSAAAGVSVTAAGRCGANATWHISGTVLWVRGSGEMTDYQAGSAPWYAFRDTVTEIRVRGSMTRVGSWSFCNFSKLSAVSLPATVTRIGTGAFDSCPCLQSMTQDQTQLKTPEVKAPAAVKLQYTGSPQKLASDGSAVNGTLIYALGSNGTDIPETGWSESIPTGTKSGTWFVWYMVVGNDEYADLGPVCLESTIAEAPAATNVPKTGDGARPLLWGITAALGLALPIVLLSVKRARRK